MTVRMFLPVALALSASAPAVAGIPDPVRAMIDAAIKTGDKGMVATVIELARLTNPDDADEIAAIHQAFLDAQRKQEAIAEAREERAILAAGVFDNWSGKGEVGAFRSTGNNSNTGLTGNIELTRKGLDWSHRLRARADYQRSNGVTTRERYLAAYEPRYQINDRLFAYGLGQYEQDRFQGFGARYSASAGVGYRIIEEPGLTLDAKAGPAYRLTQYVSGENESRIGGLAGFDFDWAITDRLKFTQDSNLVAETGAAATIIIDSSNTTLNLISGLQFAVTDKISMRVSYQIDYESNPPAGTENTDTLSRFSVVYGF